MKAWPIVCACIFLGITLLNPKTRLVKVVKEQFNIYKNDRTGKIYWLDITCFIVIPVALAVIVSLNFPLSEIVTHAGTIITVFSLIVTLPLSFLALLIDKILQSKKEQEVAKETFVSITLDILYSMVVIGIIIVSAYCDMPEFVQKLIVGIIAFLVIKIALNILMILKRVFSIWEQQ